jgi:hypothetical protein
MAAITYVEEVYNWSSPSRITLAASGGRLAAACTAVCLVQLYLNWTSNATRFFRKHAPYENAASTHR